MKKPEMRLQFENDDLKLSLITRACELGISLNLYVNMICAAEISEQDKKTFETFKELNKLKEIELKRL